MAEPVPPNDVDKSGVHVGADGGVQIDGPASDEDNQRMASQLTKLGFTVLDTRSTKWGPVLAGFIKTAEKGNVPATLDELIKVNQLVADMAGAKRGPVAQPKFIPEYAGLPEATVGSAKGAREHEGETFNAHANPEAMEAGAATLTNLLDLIDIMEAIAAYAGRTAAPLAAELFTSVTAVCNAAEKALPSNPDLKRTLRPALDYKQGRIDKMLQSRRHGEVLSDKVEEATTQKVQGQARSEARAQAKAELTEDIDHLFKKKKKDE